MATTDLGKWMITNGGTYDPEATYEQLTMVMYDNSTYITLKTVTGITPSNDKQNYILMAQGFDATALSSVQAEDTSGLLGLPGESVSAQSLVDYLADAVATKLLKKTDIATTIQNSTDTVPASSLLYELNNDMVPSKIGLQITFINSSSGSGSAFYIKIGKMLFISMDINFQSLSDLPGQISFDLPTLMENFPIDLKFNDKICWADITPDGILNIWTNYGIGRYAGTCIAFMQQT